MGSGVVLAALWLGGCVSWLFLNGGSCISLARCPVSCLRLILLVFYLLEFWKYFPAYCCMLRLRFYVSPWSRLRGGALIVVLVRCPFAYPHLVALCVLPYEFWGSCVESVVWCSSGRCACVFFDFSCWGSCVARLSLIGIVFGFSTSFNLSVGAVWLESASHPRRRCCFLALFVFLCDGPL